VTRGVIQGSEEEGGEVMDDLHVARERMESADDAFTRAIMFGSSTVAALDVLAQAVADAEQAYYRAVDFWEPAGAHADR